MFEILKIYMGSPPFVKITIAVPHFSSFGLCSRKWGIFALVGSLELEILYNAVFFFKPHNPGKSEILGDFIDLKASGLETA